MKEAVFVIGVVFGLFVYVILVSAVIERAVSAKQQIHGLDRPEIVRPM